MNVYEWFKIEAFYLTTGFLEWRKTYRKKIISDGKTFHFSRSHIGKNQTFPVDLKESSYLVIQTDWQGPWRILPWESKKFWWSIDGKSILGLSFNSSSSHIKRLAQNIDSWNFISFLHD